MTYAGWEPTPAEPAGADQQEIEEAIARIESLDVEIGSVEEVDLDA